MVKNDGGNKGKGLARKHVSSGGSNKQLRVAVEDGERDRLMKNEPCFKSVTVESDADSRSSSSANAQSTVQFTDSATLKYSNMVKGQDDDDDDDDLVQQRAYDMPTSSDDDDDDDDDEEADEDDVPVPVPAAALKPKLKVDHINVDDI
jgi:hypothetical protein